MKKNSFKFITVCCCLVFSPFLSGCSSSENENNLPEKETEEVEEVEENNELIFKGETTSDRLTDNEDRFYINKIPTTEVAITLNGDYSTTDSQLLNDKIESVSNAGGGIIRIKKGNYCLKNILLRSNIHLKIDADVTIQPDISSSTARSNLNIFIVGEDFYVENVAITNSEENSTNVSTWFKAVIPAGDNLGVRFVEFGNVKNFKLSGLSLTDNYSRFSNIVLNLPSNNNITEISTEGIIKDVVMTGMHVGYGVVQMQTGKSVLYKNLDGQGGVTLRVETGAAATNQVNTVTVDDVVGRNITSRFGDAAFNMSPHRVNQGRVDIDGIVAINSTHAAQIAAGFISSKTGLIDNMGTFDSRSYIGNITVTGGEGAQIKGKDFKYFDCVDRKELILKCQNSDNESTPGHSIGTVRNNAGSVGGCTDPDNGCYDVVVGEITKTNTNFEQDDFIIYPTNAITSCASVETPADGSCI